MKPIQAPADFVSVNGVLGQLQSAQMTALKDRPEELKDLKQYGLDKPAVVATIGMGTSTVKFELGKEADAGAVWARDPSKAGGLQHQQRRRDGAARRRSTTSGARKCSTSGRSTRRASRLPAAKTTRAFERVKGTGENAVDTWKQVVACREDRRFEQPRRRAARFLEPSRRELRRPRGRGHRPRQPGRRHRREVRRRQERRAGDDRHRRRRRVRHTRRSAGRAEDRSRQVRRRHQEARRHSVEHDYCRGVTRAAIALAAALAVCGVRIARRSGRGPPPAAPQSRAAAADSCRPTSPPSSTTPQFERSFWSVLVRPADSSDNLYSLNAAKLMMPGSTMKIVTAGGGGGAARVGPSVRDESRLGRADRQRRAARRPHRRRRRRPEHQRAQRHARHVAGHRAPAARGRHRAHRRRHRRRRRPLRRRGFGDGWTLDNLPYGYSAAVSALEYNEGSVDLVIRAGAAAGDPVAIQVRPEGSGLQIDNRLVTVAESGTGALTLHRLPGSSRSSCEGQIPAKAAPFARTASVDNPTAFFVIGVSARARSPRASR